MDSGKKWPGGGNEAVERTLQVRYGGTVTQGDGWGLPVLVRAGQERAATTGSSRLQSSTSTNANPLSWRDSHADLRELFFTSYPQRRLVMDIPCRAGAPYISGRMQLTANRDELH